MSMRILVILAILPLASSTALAADSFPPIPRVLPPAGLEIPAEVRSRLEKRLRVTKKRSEAIDDEQKPDIEALTKAVELALVHREFYVEKDFDKADWALDEANKRLDSLNKNESPWRKTTGTVVAGYRSSIDGSAQPYGLVIPKDHDFTKPCPLYVWLHGRGDKNTDLHFLQERATKTGQITPPNAIVVHPFGRHCVGWKHAGEIDVLEVVESVKKRYKIDADRVVLIGFSMGGAGAWHIGAHYADHWVAVSPGAGFVDVAKYQKLTPNRYGEWYVQKLWGLYDVPDCVRNLFNTNVIAYSGELDKQREAAVIMENAFKAEGHTLTHLIGPAVEHKYEPETLRELLSRLDAIVEKGKDESPDVVHLQTRTLRYEKQHWVGLGRLEEHWRDARLDAERSADKIEVRTSNVAVFFLAPITVSPKLKFIVDNQEIPVRQQAVITRGGENGVFFKKHEGKWELYALDDIATKLLTLEKRPKLQGPIDDAFLCRSLLVIEPTGKSRSARAQEWVDNELAHFRDRWRALMRGDLPLKKDTDVTDADLERAGSVVVWGDPESNRIMSRLVEKSPVRFSGGNWSLGDTSYDAGKFIPALIYPRLKANGVYDYVVLNSGLTFREAHDRTNSQQNPKLPDWAIIDISQPPDANAPGRIHDADFFDENWQLKRQPKGP
jgi:pimeloyl-ACP methyl ester carboxylesterase